MSTVRFANICDLCGIRSKEYYGWMTCTECGVHVCPECDCLCLRDDETGKTVCKGCHYSNHRRPMETEMGSEKAQDVLKEWE
jgi:hypothetical protein